MWLNEHMYSHYFGKQTEAGVKSGLALQIFLGPPKKANRRPVALPLPPESSSIHL